MVEVTHDWDTEDYEQTLEAAYDEYRLACYGAESLPLQQLHETKLAFLSGILWLACRENYCPDDLAAASRKIACRMNPHIGK